jgi:FlaA1/EpsC-like NDP-sugar epimerase
MRSLLPARAPIALLYDALASVLAWSAAFLIAYPSAVSGPPLLALYYSLAIVTGTQLACFVSLRLYRGIWRYASFRDLRQIAVAVTLATLIHTTLLFLLQRGALIPRSALLINPVLLLVLMAAGRIGYRWWKEHRPNAMTRQQGTPLLVLGAGEAGYQVVRDLTRRGSWTVVGVLDDKPEMIGRELNGIPIAGPWSDIATVADFTDARHAVLAVGSGNHAARRRAFELCDRAGIKLMVMPDIEDALARQVAATDMRHIDVDDLLRRDPVQLDNRGLAHMLTGRTVLVTGAGGSIGSDLCRQIARFEPARLVLVESSEYALYQITEELGSRHPEVPVHALVGDIKHTRRLDEVFSAHQPDIVFHAAAYKHVPLMEVDNAWQAVTNNVGGTLKVIDAAIRHNVQKLVMISTDKAVNPTNVMGATKRLSELLALRRQASCRLQIVTVRFGNVLGSTGSVIPKFKAQIARGGPVTVTDPEVRRYFMSVSEASQLVLQAATMGKGGEIFVLEMGEPVKIVDLAHDLIRLSGASTQQIKIVYTGLRPGEKLYEELLADGEATLPTHHPKVRISRHEAVPGSSWEREVLTWLNQESQQMDVDVRSALARYVPEYRPFVMPEQVAPASPAKVVAIETAHRRA